MPASALIPPYAALYLAAAKSAYSVRARGDRVLSVTSCMTDRQSVWWQFDGESTGCSGRWCCGPMPHRLFRIGYARVDSSWGYMGASSASTFVLCIKSTWRRNSSGQRSQGSVDGVSVLVGRRPGQWAVCKLLCSMPPGTLRRMQGGLPVSGPQGGLGSRSCVHAVAQ